MKSDSTSLLNTADEVPRASEPSESENAVEDAVVVKIETKRTETLITSITSGLNDLFLRHNEIGDWCSIVDKEIDENGPLGEGAEEAFKKVARIIKFTRPFYAYVSNISFFAKMHDIYYFFGGANNIERFFPYMEAAKYPDQSKNSDGQRFSGNCMLELKDIDALVNVLKLDGRELFGRVLYVESVDGTTFERRNFTITELNNSKFEEVAPVVNYRDRGSRREGGNYNHNSYQQSENVNGSYHRSGGNQRTAYGGGYQQQLRGGQSAMFQKPQVSNDVRRSQPQLVQQSGSARSLRQSQLSSGYQQQGGSCQYQQYHNTDAPSGFQPSASMPKPKPTAKDIYGNAKIVDTSERLRQIESKIARERKGTAASPRTSQHLEDGSEVSAGAFAQWSGGDSAPYEDGARPPIPPPQPLERQPLLSLNPTQQKLRNNQPLQAAYAPDQQVYCNTLPRQASHPTTRQGGSGGKQSFTQRTSRDFYVQQQVNNSGEAQQSDGYGEDYESVSHTFQHMQQHNRQSRGGGPKGAERNQQNKWETSSNRQYPKGGDRSSHYSTDLDAYSRTTSDVQMDDGLTLPGERNSNTDSAFDARVDDMRRTAQQSYGGGIEYAAQSNRSSKRSGNRMSFRSSGGMENARRSNSDLHEGGPRRRGSANNFASCEQGGNSSKPGARPQIRREEISKLKNYMGQGADKSGKKVPAMADDKNLHHHQNSAATASQSDDDGAASVVTASSVRKSLSRDSTNNGGGGKQSGGRKFSRGGGGGGGSQRSVFTRTNSAVQQHHNPDNYLPPKVSRNGGGHLQRKSSASGVGGTSASHNAVNRKGSLGSGVPPAANDGGVRKEAGQSSASTAAVDATTSAPTTSNVGPTVAQKTDAGGRPTPTKSKKRNSKKQETTSSVTTSNKFSALAMDG